MTHLVHLMSSKITKSGGSWIKREKRWAIYHRDDYRCLYCTADLSEVIGNLTLHHLKGSDDHGHGNLVTCCKRCADQKRNGGLVKFDTAMVRARINKAIRKPLDMEAGRKAYLDSRKLKGKTKVAVKFLSNPDADYGFRLPVETMAEATLTTDQYLMGLAKEGKIPPLEKGTCDVVKVFQALLAIERERAASGESAKMNDEKLRKLTAEREQAEYRNLKDQGKMVEKVHAMKFCVDAGIIIRQRIAACQSLSHDERDALLEEISTRFHDHVITDALEPKGD